MIKSKTHNIFLESYRNNSFIKVRLKVDPINKNLKEFAYLNGYEGYIINEDIENNTVDVVILGDLDDGPVIKNIPNDCVDRDSLLKRIDKFKIAVRSYLKHKLDIDEDSDIYIKINIANSLQNIEKELKEFGLNNESICEIYKLYVIANETF